MGEPTRWLALLDAVLLVLLVGVAAVTIRPSRLSTFEVRRRAQLGDGDAQQARHRHDALPQLRALHWLIETVLLVLLAAVTISWLGWIVGTLGAIIAALSRGVVARWRWLRHRVQAWYDHREPRIIHAVRGRRWLRWITPASPPVTGIKLGSKQDLQNIVASSAVLSPDDQKHYQAVLSFADTRVADIMTPVTALVSIDVNETIGPLVMDSLHKTGHRQFPVTDGDIHHIVGILSIQDLIELKSEASLVRQAMDPRVSYIHESTPAREALRTCMSSRRQLCIVVNDDRQTVGLLTLGDVLTALLGTPV